MPDLWFAVFVTTAHCLASTLGPQGLRPVMLRPPSGLRTRPRTPTRAADTAVNLRQAEGELAPDSEHSRMRHEAAACHPEVASNRFGEPSNLKRQFIPKNPQRFEVRSCWLNLRYEYCLHLIRLKHKIPKIDVKQKAGIDRIWRAKRS
jgi:hypothetical protein